MAKRTMKTTTLFAGILFVAELLLLAAWLTADFADPPRPLVYPARTQAYNLLGQPGAWTASYLRETLGWTTYPLFCQLLVVVLWLLLPARRTSLIWSLVGWTWLVPVTAWLLHAIAALTPNTFPPLPGGHLGLLLYQALVPFLAPSVQVIVAGCLFSALVVLAAKSFCRRSFQWLGHLVGWYARMLRDSQPGGTAEPRSVVYGAIIRRSSTHTDASSERHPDTGKSALPPTSVLTKPQVGASASASPSEASSVDTGDRATPACPLPLARQSSPPASVASAGHRLPPLTLLEDAPPMPLADQEQHWQQCAARLEQAFADFGLTVRVVGINTGPVITQYEVALETGLRVHRVTSLADDLALKLKVPSVRVVAPIPGKGTVGIEIPNEQRIVVRLKEVLVAAQDAVRRQRIPLFLGKDTEGKPLVYDLAEMPHLLIAGRTGTGKSVCMNAIILSILMTRRPEEVRMIMIDPKMLELSEYSHIPHLMHPVVKDMRKAEAILAWAVDKMEERYDLLCRARVRSIAAYNDLPADEIYRRVQPADAEEKARIPARMPYIVIFVDEMNDLMMTMRKEVEGHIIRLAQKSRAAGIHLVVATQKPTVDVITGLIKSNLPARICFQVSSRSDSRVVLDEIGAEKLLGKGDMLFLQPGTSTILRAQGTYVSDTEISRVVEYLHSEPRYAADLLQLSSTASSGTPSRSALVRARDELYEQAVEIVVRERRGSVSLLQRALGIGYGRAARLIDFMAEDGIVGPYNGSNAREVLVTLEQWETMRQRASRPLAS